MKKEQLLKISFFISLIGILIGSFLKITHSPSADIILEFSMLLYLVFAALVIYEVYQSNKIETTEKIMWSVGVIFLGSIAGILYLATRRKRIVNNLTNTNPTSSLYEN